MSAPIVARVFSQRGRYRVEFEHPNQPRSQARFESDGEVAVALALGLNGAREPRPGTAPAVLAELVMRGAARHGVARIRALSEQDRTNNRTVTAPTIRGEQIVDDLTGAFLREHRRIWGGGPDRSERLIGLAYGLTSAIERGALASAPRAA